MGYQQPSVPTIDRLGITGQIMGSVGQGFKNLGDVANDYLSRVDREEALKVAERDKAKLDDRYLSEKAYQAGQDEIANKYKQATLDATNEQNIWDRGHKEKTLAISKDQWEKEYGSNEKWKGIEYELKEKTLGESKRHNKAMENKDTAKPLSLPEIKYTDETGGVYQKARDLGIKFEAGANPEVLKNKIAEKEASAKPLDTSNITGSRSWYWPDDRYMPKDEASSWFNSAITNEYTKGKTYPHEVVRNAILGAVNEDGLVDSHAAAKTLKDWGDNANKK